MRVGCLVLLASILMTSCNSGPGGGPHPKGQTEVDLLERLAYEKGEAVWRVSETKAGGTQNLRCFPAPHNGAVIFWPSHRTLSFSLNQGGHQKTLTATFVSKPEHEVKFYWDQISESIGLWVDGKPAGKREVADDSRPWRLVCPS